MQTRLGWAFAFARSMTVVNELADPDASLRNLPFGAGRGMVTYPILECEREVHVVSLVWAG